MLLGSLFSLGGSSFLGSGGLCGGSFLGSLLCCSFSSSLLGLGLADGLLCGSGLLGFLALGADSSLLVAGCLGCLLLARGEVCAILVGDDGVGELHDAALAVGGLTLMDDALGDGAIHQTACIVSSLKGSCAVAGLNSFAHSTGCSFQFGTNGTIAHTRLLVGDNSFLLTLNVGHVVPPLVTSSFH